MLLQAVETVTGTAPQRTACPPEFTEECKKRAAALNKRLGEKLEISDVEVERQVAACRMLLQAGDIDLRRDDERATERKLDSEQYAALGPVMAPNCLGPRIPADDHFRERRWPRAACCCRRATSTCAAMTSMRPRGSSTPQLLP